MSQTSVIAPRRRVGVAVVVALVGSLIGAATSSTPVSAVSSFAVDLVPQEELIAGTSGDVLLSITNNGPDGSTGGSFIATFPVGFMPVAVDDNTCTVSPQPAPTDPPAAPIPTDVDCPLGPLGAMGAGTTVAIMVRVEIDPDYVFDNGGGAGSATADVDVEVTHDDGTQSATKTVIIGERSDLRVRKYASEPVAYPGDILTYQIDVDNLGPSTARNVTVRDTLMGLGDGEESVSIQSCAFSVSQGGGSITQFTCTTGTVIGTQFGTDIGTFGTNKLEPINLLDGAVGGRMRGSFRLTALSATSFDNEVRVLSDTPDPDNSNNMTNAAGSFQAVADLSITKTASVPNPLPGDLVVYTITATNNGPSDATNVVVKDLLPAGLEFVSATTPGGTCLSGTPGDIDDPVTCNLGTIVKPISSVAQSEVITLTARVAASATPGAVIFNRAMVSSDTPDLNNANDAAQASITVDAPPPVSSFAVDLVPQEELIAGLSGDVRLSITNNGPDGSTGGSFSATFPVGFMPVAVDDSTCTVSAQPAPPAAPVPTDVDCPDLGPLGVMAAGETVAIMVRVEIDPDYVFDNGGGAGSATADVDVEVTHDGGTQSATKTVIIGERSDLRVRKYASEPVAFAGDIVTYQIDVDNLGPSTARNVTVRDTLMGHGFEDSGDVSIQSCAFSVSQGGGAITQFTCTTGTVVGTQFGTDIGTFGTNKLEPINLLDGAVGGRLRGAFRLTVNDATWFDNEVRVLSDTPDPNSSNNMANAAISFQAVADLSITKTASVPTPLPGDLVVYTITATNNGPSDATNVVVRDLLPAGLEFVSVTTPGGTCLSGTPGDISDPVVCYLGTIVKPISSVAQSEVITLTARVAASATPGAVIFNRAMVSSNTPDLNNANDAAEASIEVDTPVTDTLLFNPLVPARQFDTRDGTGGVPIAKLVAGVPLEFEMAGANGVPLDALAVALNVTATGPVADGWLTVYPCDTPPVEASNLNFVAGQTVANAVIAPIDAAGKVCFVSSVDTDVLSDVSGWFADGEGMTTLSPVREFDTRTGLGGVPMGKRSAGSVLTFKVTGVNGVPSSGVGAVALNVTVTQPDGAGYVTVFPCGELPTASNINYTVGRTVPNLVIAPVSPQGTVCFMTSNDTHLLADVSAWFEDGSDHHAVNPVRVLDTRNGLGGVAVRRLLAGETYEVDLAGRLGVPASGAGSVVLNVTVTGPLLPGYITVFPCGVRPLSSNANYTTGQTVANAVIAPLSTDGTVCFYTSKSTNLVVDLAGWFTGAGV